MTEDYQTIESAEKLLEPEKPGWFEILGIKFFEKLAIRGNDAYGFASNDKELASKVRRITYTNALIAFVIGATGAGASVYTEVVYKDSGATIMWSMVALVTLVFTVLEFVVLFYVSLNVVYNISRVTGHNHLQKDEQIDNITIPNLLARAALEIPEPGRHILGVDPLARVSKKKMLFVGKLYKAKVVTSNVLAKMFLRRVAGKSLTRIGLNVAYISTPITGFWNAFVIYKVAKDARLRLFGNLLANYMVQEIITKEKLSRLSEKARRACIRAVGNSIVLTQNAHPNMLILMVRLSYLLNIKEGDNFDDWEIFLQVLDEVEDHERFFILDLLAISTAFDGKLSRMEREHLPAAFKEHTETYFIRIVKLRKLLVDGRYYEAKNHCQLDFEPG